MDPTLRQALILYTFLVLGLFLAVTPWTPVWYEATVLLLPTRFGLLAQNVWVRALVSMIGILDLLVALSAAHELALGAMRRR